MEELSIDVSTDAAVLPAPSFCKGPHYLNRYAILLAPSALTVSFGRDPDYFDVEPSATTFVVSSPESYATRPTHIKADDAGTVTVIYKELA